MIDRLNKGGVWGKVRVFDEQAHMRRKEEIMQKCFDCWTGYGLGNVGITRLAKACGMATGSLYTYFEDMDDLVVQCTEYCMSKVEDDFMAKAPSGVEDLTRFINEVPYWTAKEHGKKYRFMYQVYTNPKYVAYGKKFFEGVNRRYAEYASMLAPSLGMPNEDLVALIFILVRACVHYALFEDEYYLNAQISIVKKAIGFCLSSGERSA